jgi:negative regulator of sigma E activity
VNLTSPCGRNRSVWVAGGAAAALAVLWGLAAADSAASPIQAVRSDPDAMRMLRNAATAAQSTPYHGTEFLTAWHDGTATTSTVAVAHIPGNGTLLGMSGAGGAKGGPTGMFEPDDGRGQPGLGGYTPVMLDLLTRNYTVVRSADDQLHGRAAQVVEARRADGSAAGRFWIDRSTGIMLYRELLDRYGRTIVAAGFKDLTIAAPTGQTVPQSATASPAVGLMAGAWNHELTGSELKALPGAGPGGTSWRVPRELPGHLSLYVAKSESTGGAERPVQLGYTDGLYALSVFVQRGVLDSGKFAGWRRATVHGHTVYERSGRQYWRVWAARGQVYTVVGDAAPDTTDAVVSALPHGGPGLWQRLDRGLHRLAGWANPFG